MDNQKQFIAFEQPLNERVRTFLRLDHLFKQAEHHRNDVSLWGRHSCLTATLDILTILARSDLRTEVVKEIENQRMTLGPMRNRPGVDHARLDQIMDQLKQHERDMESIPHQFAASLIRENDFLTSLLNRIAIPGGWCSFDLPAYHRWLSQNPVLQNQDLDNWYRFLTPFQDSIGLVVNLIRQSAHPQGMTADEGVYVHVMEGHCQMVRVLLPAETDLFPEISAGKHRCTIRFMQQSNMDQKPHQSHDNIDFRFALCVLG